MEYRRLGSDEENDVYVKDYGYITIKNVDHDNIPKINDCCDDGLNITLHTRVQPNEYFPGEVEAVIDAEIWIGLNHYQEVIDQRKILEDNAKLIAAKDEEIMNLRKQVKKKKKPT